MNKELAHMLRTAPLSTPTALSADAVRDISAALTALLADVFALYMKTKNFHWHMSGPHFRDYHLLLDDQGDQIFAMTDPLAERVRKIGGTTLRSAGHVTRVQRILDNDAEYVSPPDMLAELRDDNAQLSRSMRHTCCAMRQATLPPQACWKTGSTRPRGVPGSCSNAHGRVRPGTRRVGLARFPR
jgi:starvation-inducible DNA-binding protein